ncbi:MAG: heavy metal translocating P-type ATPase [Eubacteriales bacterium]
MKQNFDIKNMTCASCSASVTRAVVQIKGVQSAEVRLISNDMTVEYDSALVDEKTIMKAVSAAGYEAFIQESDRSKRERARREAIDKNLKTLRKRFLLSALLLLPLLYVSMSDMTHLPVFWWLEVDHPGRAVVQAVLSLAISVINYNYFTNGFKLLVRLHPNMDSLVALGCTSSLVYSAILAALGNYHMLYFESAGTILTLVTLGKLLEARSKRSTNTSVTSLLDLSPKTVTVRLGDEYVIKKAEDIQKGDIIAVKSGESLAADGVVVSGKTELDMSSITGEHEPVFKSEGDEVLTSSKNISGYFEYRAEKVGEDTILAEIVRLVEQAGNSKPPIARLADKISLYFVPIVIAVSLITALYWILAGKTYSAFVNAVSVLVISCPCALGLATPISVMAGTGKGAEKGVLFKSAEAIETLGKCSAAVLDKTGTITEGRPVVSKITADASSSENEILTVAASLESVSTHPLAEAIIEKAKEYGLSIPEGSDVAYIPGKGAAGFVNGEYCAAGNLGFLLENGVAAAGDALVTPGKTAVYVASGDRFLGVIETNDSLRKSSAEAIARLKEKMRVIMVTGDSESSASGLARELGIDFKAGVLPGGKEQIVSSLKSEGKKVMMIGDGVNDAPALSAADVGIAIGAGTYVAIDSADVVLSSNDLGGAVTAVRLSGAVMKNIKENLFWALIYNCIGIPLAAGVFSFAGVSLTPVYAAAAMSFSSVCVSLNALRLKNFK